jgi:hypothetical protein
MENIADNFRLALVGGENFNGLVGGNKHLVDHFARSIPLNPIPLEDSSVGYDRSIAKHTTQFREGAGDLGWAQRLVNRGN